MSVFIKSSQQRISDVNEVKFLKGLQSDYDSMSERSSDTLYFCTDSKKLYMGDTRYSDGNLQRQVLWINSNFSATNFEAQELDIQTSRYDCIDIVFTLATIGGLRFRICQCVRNLDSEHGYGSSLLFFSGYVSSTLINASRRVNIENDTIVFYDAYYNRSLDNQYVVPLAIIGKIE